MGILIVVIFSACLISYLVLKIGNSIWWKPKRLGKQLKLQGIKGNHYKVLLGDMKELVNQYKEAWSKPSNLNHQIAARVDPFTHTMVDKYGKVSLCWTGPTPSLVIKDPEMIKQVLINKQGHFQKPYINPLILVLTKGITTLEGDKWAKHRKIINPAFHIQKLKGMVPVMAATCNEFIDRWRSMINPEEGSCELDIWPEFQNLTADVISRTGFGSNYEEGSKIFKLQKELVTLVIEAMQTLYIPGFRFIPTKKNRRRKELDKMITSMLTDLIRKRENTIRSQESQTDDLLGLLLHSNYQNNEANKTEDLKHGGMAIEEVIEECKQFYLAGQETTASLLTWTIIVLAMHPDWQEKARDEVMQACGRDSINFEAIKNLSIVTMILNEVLRLYPPVIAHYRHTYKETKIGEISIPAGVNVTLPTLLMQHDHDIWGNDAEEFKPERFSEGAAKASKDAFFPFGYGPRICVGQIFALIEAKVALSMILQNFSIQLSPSYIHAPHTVMMLQPQHGAHIILQPRY
ncbi:cytochrome P450 CYP72A616-like [Silene latifolia]|uniref:cytochrome P450 CYP72A616-like n=1 Tax=Silene latifolia TaxID=37657 RepID=UPI003D77D8F6